MTTCPCCGSEVPDADLIFDPETASVGRFGRLIFLTRTMFRILRTLKEAAPRTVRYDSLITAMYDLDEPDDAMNVVRALLVKNRPGLAAVGISIVTVWGIGYRFELVSAPFEYVKRTGLTSKRKLAA